MRHRSWRVLHPSAGSGAPRAPLSLLPVRNGRSPHTVVTMGPDSCAHSRYARLLVYRAPRLLAAAALSASSCASDRVRCQMQSHTSACRAEVKQATI